MLRKIAHLILAPFGSDTTSEIQWFYTLVIAIHCMFAWCFLNSELALTFTILWGLHFVSIYITSYMLNHDMKISDEGHCLRFLILNILLFLSGLLTYWWWTLVTVIVSLIVYKIAVIKDLGVRARKNVSISSILLFAIFLSLTFGLPITFGWKLIIILVFMIYQHINVKMVRRGYCINYVIEDFSYIILNMQTKREVKNFFEGKKK